jgi:hypothetical protein
MIVAPPLVVDVRCGITTEVAAITVSLEDTETELLPVTR